MKKKTKNDCENCQWMDILEKSIALNKQMRRNYIEHTFPLKVISINNTPLKLSKMSLN